MNKGKLLVIISAVTVTAIGFSAGFFGPRLILPSSIPTISPTPLKILPINSFFNNLYAKARGTMVAKTADSLTLKKDNQTLVIKIDESSVSSFNYKTATGSADLRFSEIQVGDELEGGISILPQDTVMGHRFDVQRKTL